MNVLVLNAGSSSLKYQLVDPATGQRTLAGTLEELGQGRSHEDALKGLLAQLGDAKIDAVGHRVVHGGERFVDAVRIDDDVLAAIEAQVPLAPLHNPANLAGIRAARVVLPDVPHVAVFDTAFHVRMPRRARTYALDPKLAEEKGLRRFGFHGTSHRFVAELAGKHLARPLAELRLVSLHLGNRASACAIEHGHSVETSMGLTPLEGLVMGTRSGDLDPGIVLKLARELGVDAAETLLNKKSGLAGLSGASNDLRVIQSRAAEGDDAARLAINVFAHRVRKYVGAYAAVMGGLGERAVVPAPKHAARDHEDHRAAGETSVATSQHRCDHRWLIARLRPELKTLPPAVPVHLQRCSRSPRRDTTGRAPCRARRPPPTASTPANS